MVEKKQWQIILENVSGFLQGFLKIGLAANAPVKCIGCGKCNSGQPCPFGARRMTKPKV